MSFKMWWFPIDFVAPMVVTVVFLDRNETLGLLWSSVSLFPLCEIRVITTLWTWCKSVIIWRKGVAKSIVRSIYDRRGTWTVTGWWWNFMSWSVFLKICQNSSHHEQRAVAVRMEAGLLELRHVVIACADSVWWKYSTILTGFHKFGWFTIRFWCRYCKETFCCCSGIHTQIHGGINIALKVW